MPLDKQSERTSEGTDSSKRSRYGFNRCTAAGSHGQCYIGTTYPNAYCEWHTYAIQEQRTPHLGLEAFAKWLDVQIYQRGDRRWLLATTEQWWDGLSGVAALPPPACDTCGTILVQGSTLIDFPDDRGKFCDKCWPGPLYPPLAREAAYLAEQKARTKAPRPRPRRADDSMKHVSEIATQHSPPPEGPAEEEQTAWEH